MINEIKHNNALFRQLLFLAGLITLGIIIFEQLRFFLGAFLGAFTIYIVLRDIQFKLTEKKNWRPWRASLLLVLIASVVLLGIGFLLFELVASEISTIDASKMVADINQFIKSASKKLGFKNLPDTIISSSQSLLANLAGGLLSSTYSFIANIFMMIIILFFMLANGRKLESRLTEYSPFKGKNLAILKLEVKNMIYSNAVGMPIILVLQGLAASLIYWILGIHGFFFWGFLTAICGLLPVVGTMIIYVPIAIFLIIHGNIWKGIILLLYGVTVISNADNVGRIILMKKMTNTHPLSTIFGVILGIPLFGFWGIIFGPLLIESFFLLIRMYYMEYKLIPPEEAVSDSVKEMEKEIK